MHWPTSTWFAIRCSQNGNGNGNLSNLKKFSMAPGAWQEVSRRKEKFPLGFAAAEEPKVKPYRRFHYEILLKHNPSPSTSAQTLAPHKSTLSKPKLMNSTPSPPASPRAGQATYYISPHSPTQLRFPLSAQFTEWRGRCFRCCRSGYNTATCRNPMCCGKC